MEEAGWSIVSDPRDFAERRATAEKTCSMLKFPFATVIDSMDDAIAQRWSAWPERLFVVGADGRVAYGGEQGPWGFWPVADSPPHAWGGDHGRSHGEPLDRFLEEFLIEKPNDSAKEFNP